MSLEYAILGFLNYHPATGYDLKKMFDSSVRHFWYADQSQIYRTLSRLTDSGLVRMEHVPQEGRPDRKLYHITQAGREAFDAWLAGPFPVQPSRSGPLVQVFFSARLDQEELIAKFETAAAIFRTMLDQYNAVPEQSSAMLANAPGGRDRYFWLQTLELGKLTAQAQLEWAETILADLRAGRVPETRG